MVLTNEDDEGNFRDSCKPGIANQLWVERKQTFWIVRIASASRFPIDDATYAIEFADCIHISQEIAPSCQVVKDPDLQVLLRILNADAVILRKSLQQMDPLMREAVPRLTLFVIEPGMAVSTPISKECSTGVVTSK